MYPCPYYDGTPECQKTITKRQCLFNGDADRCHLIDMVPMNRLTKHLDHILFTIEEEEKQDAVAGQQILRDRWEDFKN